MHQRILALVVFLFWWPGLVFPADLDDANRSFVLDDFEAALQVYAEIASGSGEEAPFAAYLAGKCHDRLGRHQKAASAYQRVMDEYPATIWAAHAGNALGDAYAALGEWEKALAAYRAVAENFHGSAQGIRARLNMAGVYNNPFNEGDNDYNAAISNYVYVLQNQDASVAGDIDLAQVYFGMGEAFRNLKRYDDAIAYFQKSQAEDADGVWGAAAQYMIGNCRLALRQNFAAAEAYRNTTVQFRQQPVFVKAANTRLGALERQGVRVEAEQAPVRTEEGRLVRLLEGSVRITAEDWRVECDRAEWDPQSRTLTCTGKVHFHSNGAFLFAADELRFRIPPDETISLPPPPAPQTMLRNFEAMQQGSFPAMQTGE